MMSKALGLALALCLVLQAQAAPAPAEPDLAVDPITPGVFVSPPNGAAHPGRAGPLTPEELDMARIAWRYFVNNTQPSTGLVNSVDDYPSATLWDTASAIAGIVCAGELGVIDRAEAQSRLDAILTTLGRLRLFRGKHPNKVYNTRTAVPSTYANDPGEIGTSAIDIGRLLIWLKIVGERYPALRAKADAAPASWNLGDLVRNGELYGANPGKDGVDYLQEGRLGYEEYAAKGFELWGFKPTEALKPEPYGLIRLYGVAVPYDARDPREFGAHNYVVTESYALDGMELGWNDPADIRPDPFVHTSGWIAAAAQNVYLVQQRRFERTGVFTARTEHQLAGEHSFVYDTIFTDGQPWQNIMDSGRRVPQFSAVALKGAFGLWALWNTPYTDQLFAYVRQAYDPAKGWCEGILESGGAIKAFSANNNGIILEALLYKAQGRLFAPARQ